MMPSVKAFFDVVLNNESYTATTELTPVGGSAYASVKVPLPDSRQCYVDVEFKYGAVVEDTRQRAECVMRSLKENDYAYAYVPATYFSLFDPKRYDGPAPYLHYAPALKHFKLSDIESGELSVAAHSRGGYGYLVLHDKYGDRVFEVFSATLIRECVMLHNAKVPHPGMRITCHLDGFGDVLSGVY